MARIIWAPNARLDFMQILLFIKRDSPDYARFLKNRIIDRIRSLEKFPKMGRKVPERNQENLRELIVEDYRIIYRIHNKMIQIEAIIHAHRRFPTHI
jgi:plasmid stabilization system protein ParE